MLTRSSQVRNGAAIAKRFATDVASTNEVMRLIVSRALLEN
jgi:hypothetical protein